MTASAALEYAKRAGEDYWGDFVSGARRIEVRGPKRKAPKATVATATGRAKAAFRGILLTYVPKIMSQIVVAPSQADRRRSCAPVSTAKLAT